MERKIFYVPESKWQRWQCYFPDQRTFQPANVTRRFGDTDWSQIMQKIQSFDMPTSPIKEKRNNKFVITQRQILTTLRTSHININNKENTAILYHKLYRFLGNFNLATWKRMISEMQKRERLVSTLEYDNRLSNIA